MEKLFYPALFHKSEEGGFWISFPYHGYIISRIFYVYQYFSVILRILFFLICLIT